MEWPEARGSLHVQNWGVCSDSKLLRCGAFRFDASGFYINSLLSLDASFEMFFSIPTFDCSIVQLFNPTCPSPLNQLSHLGGMRDEMLKADSPPTTMRCEVGSARVAPGDSSISTQPTGAVHSAIKLNYPGAWM